MMQASDVVNFPVSPEGTYRIMISFFMKKDAVEWGFTARAYDIDAPVPTYRQILAARSDIAQVNGVLLEHIGFLSWSPLA